ncbi:hypothetical protein HK104_007057 [Borealophlyctis nickersoniae]|nr:hypothetical protein HK104_007057 [Borealophlyctis nickersoniae]
MTASNDDDLVAAFDMPSDDPFGLKETPKPSPPVKILPDEWQRAWSTDVRFVPEDKGHEPHPHHTTVAGDWESHEEFEIGGEERGLLLGALSRGNVEGQNGRATSRGHSEDGEDEEKGNMDFWDGPLDGIAQTPWSVWIASKRNKLMLKVVGAMLVSICVVAAVVGLGISAARNAAMGGLDSYNGTVILVSFDGFRAEYLTRNLTPALARLGARGVTADYMTPSFPSITFPNHYTIVTGLYPESHGIVGNVFYDPVINDTFIYVDPSRNSQGKWWGGEPIWVTAIKQGLKAGTCMWPGSEAPIQGIRPTYWMKYRHTMPLPQRVDLLMSWLDKPAAERPKFLTVYIPDVDSAGHEYGVYSKQVNDSLVRVDTALNYLLTSLQSRNLQSRVNVIVVSDHGMADTSNDRLVFLDDYIAVDNVTIVENLPILMLYPQNENDTSKIVEQLRNGSQSTGHFRAYRKEDVPEEFHYSHSDRIGPIVVVPETVSDI